MSPSPIPPDAGRGPGLAGILDMVRRRRRLALLPALFVLAAAASLAFSLPAIWQARALVLVDRQQVPERIVKSTVTGDVESQLLTLSHEVLSRPRLAAIIEEHGLYPRLRASHSADDLVQRMRRDIRITPETDLDGRGRSRDERTVAFTVGYAATDPRVATAVANRLAGLFVAKNLELRTRQAAGTSEFLDTQLTEVRAALQTQERRIAEYKERHLGELPEQRETNLRTLERLQTQLQLAHENHRRASERRQLITRSLAEIDVTGGAASSGGSPGPVESAAARLALLRQELAQMQTRYSDRYPDVVALKDQIRALEARVTAEPAAAAPRPLRREAGDRRAAPQNPYVMSLMQQLDQASVETTTTTEEIAQLNRQLAVYQRRIENTPRREQELALIARDHETTRELFRSLLAKRGEAGIAADLEARHKGESFRIIEAAGMPERPVGPARMRLLLAGLVLALGAGAGAVLLAEQVDTSYRSVDEVRAGLPVPVLSAIPRITTEGDRRRRARQRRLAFAAVAGGLLLVAGSSFAFARHNDGLVALLTPADALAGTRH
jgi:polysaccharide chain length determinant protein (PEP-CTERM system associated)